MPQNHPTTSRLPLILGVCLAACGLAGCAATGDTDGGSASGPAVVQRGDFKAAEPAPAPPTVATSPASLGGQPRPAPAAAPWPTLTPAQAWGGMEGVALLTGTGAPRPAAGAQASQGMLLVDALVGQINGKPVYASKFLAPLDGRLRAKVIELDNNRAWQREAGKIIYDALIDQIRDELFLAEARAGLTSDQRRGLLAFVEQLRRNFASQSEGSEELADERSREAEGVSLDKKISDERDKALIRTLVSQQVNPRVNIAWKDIQRRYERDARIYNPPPVANLRMIWVPSGKVDAASAVATRLASGEAFAAVARDPINEFSSSEGGLIERTFEPPYGSGRLWEDAILNDNARGLSVGRTSPPFTFQGHQVWMHLESITQKPGKTLEDAQLEIATKLRNEKFNEETNRLFNRILERGSRTNERDMTERLLLIASERYLLPRAAP